MTQSSAQGDGQIFTGARFPSPPPHTYFRARAAVPSPLQQERSLTAWVVGGLAASRDVCRYLSHMQFGSAEVQRHRILGLLGQYWPWKQTAQVGTLTLRPRTVWEGPCLSRNPSFLLANRWWLPYLQCSQVQEESI